MEKIDMPPISIKKIVFWIVIIILLSQIDHIIAFVLGIYRIFHFCFGPLRNCPVEAKYVVALLFLALVWITIYKLLFRR